MKSQNRFVVGFVSLAILVMLSLVVLWKGHFQVRQSGYILTCKFKNVSGLLKGSDVRYRGYKVGAVLDVIPSAEDIRVTFMVKKGVYIPKGSKLTVKFDGIVGQTYLFIDPNELSDVMHRAGDVLSGSHSSDLSLFLDAGSKGLVQAEEILQRLNILFNSKDVQAKLANILDNFNEISNGASEFFKVFGDSSNKEAISEMLGHLQNVSYRLDKVTEVLLDGEGSESDLLAFKTDVLAAFANVNRVSKRLDGLVSDHNIDHLSNVLSNASEVSDELKSLLVDTEAAVGEDRSLGFRFIRTLSKLDFDAETRIFQANVEEVAFYQADVYLNMDHRFFRIGFGDRYGKTKFLHFQQGLSLSSSFDVRLGLYNELPSFGMDYSWRRSSFNIDLYDLNDLKYQLLTSFRIGRHVSVFAGGGSSINPLLSDNVLAGMALRF
ncbi:MAG: MlaD family protein [bacterium]